MTQLIYPVTHTVDQVDDYHGTRVADPYRWLEDADSPETREWIQWQNEQTSSYLEQISAHIIRLFKLDGAPDGGISLPALGSVVQIDGQNPTQLYGYGGFCISVMPAFAIHTLIWLELGGVYASANLFGGSEYGEEWHQGGMLHHKQNVFDDFIVCADWLIAQKITSTPQLAIMGGSNGGLLVGATK